MKLKIMNLNRNLQDLALEFPKVEIILTENLSNSKNLTDPCQQCFEKSIQVTQPTALFSIKSNFLYQNQKVDNDRGMNTNHFKLKERYLPDIGLRLGPGIWLHQTKSRIKFHLHHKYDNHRAVYCQGKKILNQDKAIRDVAGFVKNFK